MNRRQHAAHARALIAACGGLEEAAGKCRVGKSQLSDYQSVHGEGFMPADVVADLEAYCETAIYSAALAQAQPAPRGDAARLVADACEAAESATDLQRAVRLAAEDGRLTPAETQRLTERWTAAMRELRDVGALLGAAAA